MLDNILKLFDQHFVASSPDFEKWDEHERQRATIALLIEMMHIAVKAERLNVAGFCSAMQIKLKEAFKVEETEDVAA